MSGKSLPTGSDISFYDDWAQRIAVGRWTDGEAFFGLPGYPYLLAVLSRVFAPTGMLAAILQIALDSGTGVLIYNITVRLRCSDAAAAAWKWAPVTAAGFAAAGAWAVFVPAQAYAIAQMPTAWATFAAWWLVWEVLRREQPLGVCRVFLWGMVLGVGAMFGATILFLVPILLAAAVWRAAPRETRVAARLIAALAVLAGVLAGTAPSWLHNTVVAREPVFLSTHSGVNFWIGNNEEANGYANFPSELRGGQADMLRDSVAAAERAVGKPLSRSAASAYWSARARAYITGQPRAWLKLLVTKARNLWSAFEYDDIGVIAQLREQRVLLPGISFGLAAALGLPGLCVASLRLRRARWVAAAVLSLAAAVLVVFVTERYRIVIVPGLLAGAACGLAGLWNDLATRRYHYAAGYGALTLAATLLVSAPLARAELWALREYTAAMRALQRGDLPAAAGQLTRALRIAPGNPDIHFVLGTVRLQERNLTAAEMHYEQVLRVNSRHAGALNNLGIIALEQQEFARAAELLRRALTIQPGNATQHYLLAHAYHGLGDRSAALAEIERAIALQPNEPKFQSLLRELR